MKRGITLRAGNHPRGQGITPGGGCITPWARAVSLSHQTLIIESIFETQIPKLIKNSSFFPKTKVGGSSLSFKSHKKAKYKGKKISHPRGRGWLVSPQGGHHPWYPGGDGGNLHNQNENQSTTQSFFFQKSFTNAIFETQKPESIKN